MSGSCHTVIWPPRAPFSNTRCCLLFLPISHTVTLLHCHTVTLYGLNRSRSGLLQIMIHVWPDLWYTGAERGDTGHRHGGRSKYHHLHTTVCSGSCMHVGDGSRRPAAKKAVELPSLRNSNAVVAFFFTTASLLLLQVSLQPSLAADRPEVAIAGSSLCDFFLDEDGLLPEWDKDSKHSKRKYSKRYLKTITIHSSDLRPHGFNVPLWYEDVGFHHCCPHCFSHLSLPPSDQPPCLQSSVQLWCALPHHCRASRNPFCLLQLW